MSLRTVSAIAALVLIAAPMASAHGAPAAREIDTRVLTDGTGNGDYGAEGSLDEGGLDILALDVYEATMPGTTQPAMVFRVIVQGGDADATHTITFDFDAGGAQTFDLKTEDLASYTSTTFPVVRGPVEVSDDGHVHAIEGVVPFAALGLVKGDTVDGIIVTSKMDDEPADEMPGSWYFGGQEVPLLPTEEEGDPGSYTLAGAGDWFVLESTGGVITPSLEDTQINLSVASKLETLDQSVALRVDAPAGIDATLSASTALLAPGGSKDITLTVSGIATGDVKVIAESDLGLTRLISFPLAGNVTVGNGAGVTGPLLAQGDSFQYRFTDPATFEFHCHPHPWMQGAVTIVEDDPTDEPQTHIIRMVEHDHSDPQTFAFSPVEITVQVNDTVVWINTGSQLHNVHGESGLGSGDGHGHDHDHDHDHGETKESEDAPGLPLVAAIMILAIVVALRRRR